MEQQFGASHDEAQAAKSASHSAIKRRYGADVSEADLCALFSAYQSGAYLADALALAELEAM